MSEIQPLEPSEKIELELFRRALQDTAERSETGTDIAQLIQTATDCVRGGMSKDDALRGLINCLIVRVKSYRDECLAHRKEAEEWHDKWKNLAVCSCRNPSAHEPDPPMCDHCVVFKEANN